MEFIRKNKLWIMSFAILLVTAGLITRFVYNNVKTYAATSYVKTHSKEAVDDRLKNFNEIKYQLGYSEHTSYDDVLADMNAMTHQKVVAAEKLGAIPMVPYTINQVIAQVRTSGYPNEDELLSILGRWQNGDFSSIVQDHNEILRLQDGTKGTATGYMTDDEEKAFILANYSSYLK